MPCAAHSQAQLRKEKKHRAVGISAAALVIGAIVWGGITIRYQEVASTNQAKAAALQLRTIDRSEWPKLLKNLDWPFRAVSFAGDGYLHPDGGDYKYKTMNGDLPLPVIWVFHRGTGEKKWIIGRYDMVQPKPESQ